jgi:hypothetical protein
LLSEIFCRQVASSAGKLYSLSVSNLLTRPLGFAIYTVYDGHSHHNSVSPNRIVQKQYS